MIGQFDAEEIETFIVWMAVLGGDTFESACDRFTAHHADNVSQYWIGDWSLGQVFDDVMELPLRNGEPVSPLAWDIYYMYEADAEWGDAPPATDVWMHQLGVFDDRRLDCDALRDAVEAVLAAAGDDEESEEGGEDDEEEDF